MELGPEFKGLPPSAWGLSADAFLATRPRVDQFPTPSLVLDRSAMEGNVAAMTQWLAERGLEIAPHGKTTMAPQLWRQLLEAGAWAITLATGWQVQVARSHGVQRILLANELVDPVALRWLASELDDPEFEFCCWVDSAEAVAAMDAALEDVPIPRRIDVLIELGASGGRAGARTVEEALTVAAAVDASRTLSLTGVAGWEGSLGSDRSEASVQRVSAFLDELVRLAGSIDWQERTPIVSAGGSAYFELVAEKLRPLAGRATVVLRSGAYQVHDDGHYLEISPFREGPVPFRSAMHGWARVVARPEPGLAILDGGKRDFPYDLGLPIPQLVAGMPDADSDRALQGSEVVKLNDQHAFLTIAPHAELPIGSVVRLGLSHPCTAFDKWRLIPVAESAGYDAIVVDLVRTWF